MSVTHAKKRLTRKLLRRTERGLDAELPGEPSAAVVGGRLHPEQHHTPRPDRGGPVITDSSPKACHLDTRAAVWPRRHRHSLPIVKRGSHSVEGHHSSRISSTATASAFSTWRRREFSRFTAADCDDLLLPAERQQDWCRLPGARPCKRARRARPQRHCVEFERTVTRRTLPHGDVPLYGSNRTFKFALQLRRVDWTPFDVLHAHGDDYWLWRRRVPAHVRTLHGSCLSEARWIQGGRDRLRMLLLGLSEILASFVADETCCVSENSRRWLPWCGPGNSKRHRPHALSSA